MNIFQLSNDQVAAAAGINRTLFDSDPDKCAIAVLTGSAGTGKTTVVTEILSQAPAIHTELGATTHRASGVLEDIVGQPVSTAHQLFKLRPTVTRFGKEVLKPAGSCQIPHGSFVTIDEVSMLGNQFLRAIVPVVQKRALKLLFVGDPYQLEPPNDTCSIFDGSLPTFTLTQVHRQGKGNPILDKAVEFRDYIAGLRQEEPTLDTMLNTDGHGIHVLPHSEFVGKFVKKYMEYTVGAAVDVPLCTYTNESAINYNSMVRKAAYFLESTVEPFYEGERLLANSIVKMGDIPVLANNETVVVQRYAPAKFNDIPGYEVVVHGAPNKYHASSFKTVFVPLNAAAANVVLDKLKAEAIKAKSKKIWAEFYEVKNGIADLRPPFAGTTHKIQGGTYPAVFIDVVNIRKCRDATIRAKLFYVALTRATTDVYINS